MCMEQTYMVGGRSNRLIRPLGVHQSINIANAVITPYTLAYNIFWRNLSTKLSSIRSTLAPFSS